MSTATASSVSHISSSYMSESTHLFYSSDGSTAQPLWGASPAADLSGLFLDPANISWPETDGTDYSPGGYSDSDHQTGFSSGLSSKSSPDDYKDLEPSYLPYGPVSPRGGLLVMMLPGVAEYSSATGMVSGPQVYSGTVAQL